ncbi:glycosyltransferase [Enterobacter sichuanensis]|uniref:glycosyltransferase n=1 Tax=Enterobacter sichuanensis TaxID=2071710 RepID=UPI003753A272
MKFTVLMSLYYKENAEYFEQCLKSIKNQTVQANEIAIVIDGPIGERLHRVINNWRTCLPIKTLQLDKNVGLGQALNKGLAICTYDLVFRMDTDDICYPNRFSLQLKEFEENEKLMLLGGHIEEYNERFDMLLGKRMVPIGNEEIRRRATLKNPFNHMTVAFRKAAVQSVGGYQHHPLMEDYNLWLRMIASNYFVDNLDAVLVKARTGESMLRRRNGLNYITSEYKLFKLKRKLKLQSFIGSVAVFLIRSVPRLMSAAILKFIYKTQRELK